MISLLTRALGTIVGFILIFYFFGGLKGVITGRLELLNKTARGNSVRIGSSILFATSIIFAIIGAQFKSKAGSAYDFYDLLSFLIPILIFVVVWFVAIHFVKKMDHVFAINDVATQTKTHEGGGTQNCCKCGRSYNVSLSIVASGEVRVAHCRVCPVDRVFAVCERCANLEEVQKNACPWCGARNLWEVTSMI